MLDIEAVKNYLLAMQNTICQALEEEDETAHFQEDEWQRKGGGGGRTRVLRAGKVFEQAGVNFSHVFGDHLPQAATAKRPELVGRNYQAMGISLVIHPDNPYIPTSHANVRFFVAEKEGEAPIWWFGGGMDLTPYYPFWEDVQHWHQVAKKACSKFGNSTYERYKKACDDYFYLPHRKETRGVGGLFFDDLNSPDFEHSFAFMQSVAEHYLLAYRPIVALRKGMPFTQQQKAFQCYRRGRYVEFNLLYDRGTLFGLQSGGRTESILMSLPPTVHWEYNYTPEPGSEEARLYQDYLRPRNWLQEAELDNN